MSLSVFSPIQLFATPWTVVHQAPLSVGFFQQEHWSGLPFSPQGIFPTQGWNPRLLQKEDSLTTEPTGKPYRKEAITQLTGLGQRSEQNPQQDCPEAEVLWGRKRSTDKHRSI